MAVKYTNIYHSKALQNVPISGIFGSKTNHLATLQSSKKIVTMRTSALETDAMNNKQSHQGKRPIVGEELANYLHFRNLKLQVFENKKNIFKIIFDIHCTR
jgi:hypothetical protein